MSRAYIVETPTRRLIIAKGLKSGHPDSWCVCDLTAPGIPLLASYDLLRQAKSYAQEIRASDEQAPQ